ncbi:MAG: SprT-like domain-containing protein [Tepidisphaeraceae bacterium]
MDIAAARTLARSLMDQHGLKQWAFGFDRAARRFGVCRPSLKQISLSWKLTLLNSEGEVRDTILHEIAHALTPGDGHGAKWKAACVRIGAKPVRCYTDATVVSPARSTAWMQIGCVQCDWWVDRRRTSTRTLVCKRCRNPVAYRDKRTGQVVQTKPGMRVVVKRSKAK